MNENHEKKNTRPYILMGFRPGIDLALRLTGLIWGACHNNIGLYMLGDCFIERGEERRQPWGKKGKMAAYGKWLRPGQEED